MVSTGIGTDNIDIVLNELDAAVNIDPYHRVPNETRNHLPLFASELLDPFTTIYLLIHLYFPAMDSGWTDCFIITNISILIKS